MSCHFRNSTWIPSLLLAIPLLLASNDSQPLPRMLNDSLKYGSTFVMHDRITELTWMKYGRNCMVESGIMFDTDSIPIFDLVFLEHLSKTDIPILRKFYFRSQKPNCKSRKLTSGYIHLIYYLQHRSRHRAVNIECLRLQYC